MCTECVHTGAFTCENLRITLGTQFADCETISRWFSNGLKHVNNNSILFFTVAQFSPSLATIFDGDKNVSCPGKSITVKCSVRGVSLQWSIGRSSIDISGSRTVTFVAGPNEENNRDIITTNIGDMVFYQNTTFVDVSNPSNSSIESELRFYIYNTKDFVEVICSDSSTNSMQKNITVLGM